MSQFAVKKGVIIMAAPREISEKVIDAHLLCTRKFLGEVLMHKNYQHRGPNKITLVIQHC